MDEIQSVDNIARHPVDTLKTPQPKNKRVIDGQWINDNQRSQCLTNIKHKSNYEIFVKLREREGQRVDLGRSLKGHL